MNSVQLKYKRETGCSASEGFEATRGRYGDYWIDSAIEPLIEYGVLTVYKQEYVEWLEEQVACLIKGI